ADSLVTESIDVLTGDGRGSSDEHSIPVTTNAPANVTVPGDQLFQFRLLTPLTGISVADADATSNNEQLVAHVSTSGGVFQTFIPGFGTSFVTFLDFGGSLADINADLAGL